MHHHSKLRKHDAWSKVTIPRLQRLEIKRSLLWRVNRDEWDYDGGWGAGPKTPELEGKCSLQNCLSMSVSDGLQKNPSFNAAFWEAESKATLCWQVIGDQQMQPSLARWWPAQHTCPPGSYNIKRTCLFTKQVLLQIYLSYHTPKWRWREARADLWQRGKAPGCTSLCRDGTSCFGFLNKTHLRLNSMIRHWDG